MAERITDNDDLVTYEILTDYDIDQLTTTTLAAESPAWATRHKRAWTKVLDRLALRRNPIEEDDLDDTSELTYATLYYVAYLACVAGRSDRHKEMAKEFWAKFNKEMEEVRLTMTDSSVEPRSAYGFQRWSRA